MGQGQLDRARTLGERPGGARTVNRSTNPNGLRSLVAK